MSRNDFELVRKVASDRALVFVPEYQLVQRLTKEVPEVKGDARLPEDAFRDALTKLFSSNDEEKAELSEIVKNVRHLEDLDPRVLAVAARFYRRYRAGLNTTSVPNPQALSQNETMGQEMETYARAVLQLHEITGVDDLPRIKTDIIAYYFMIADAAH